MYGDQRQAVHTTAAHLSADVFGLKPVASTPQSSAPELFTELGHQNTLIDAAHGMASRLEAALDRLGAAFPPVNPSTDPGTPERPGALGSLEANGRGLAALRERLSLVADRLERVV